MARLISGATTSFRTIWNETIRGTGSLHLLQRMDLKNLISRIELAASLRVHPQTIAKWTRLGIFPEPNECLSNRVILYDRSEVSRAIEQATVTRKTATDYRYSIQRCRRTDYQRIHPRWERNSRC